MKVFEVCCVCKHSFQEITLLLLQDLKVKVSRRKHSYCLNGLKESAVKFLEEQINERFLYLP